MVIVVRKPRPSGRDNKAAYLFKGRLLLFECSLARR